MTMKRAKKVNKNESGQNNPELGNKFSRSGHNKSELSEKKFRQVKMNLNRVEIMLIPGNFN